MAQKEGIPENFIHFQDGVSFKGNTRFFWNFRKSVSSGSILHPQKIFMGKWLVFVLWSTENFLNYGISAPKIAWVCKGKTP